MPTNPLLLASGELPLMRERLTVPSLIDALVAPDDLFAVRRLRGEKPRWVHGFLVLTTETSLDARQVLHLRHGLTVADVRAAAANAMFAHGFRLGTNRGHSRVLHDVTVTSSTMKSGILRVDLYLVGAKDNRVPPVRDLPALQRADGARLPVAA